ncbi:MAG: FtsQ-type POTRA domain-containing protein [Magnetococcales bacterium]|nr:FtsQ-type POTRA domain-containing protein [Magnetococcales bacterium]
MLHRILILLGILFLVASLALGWWVANQPGRFALQRIQLNGFAKTTKAEALDQIGVQAGANLLWVDPRTVRDRLQVLPWVRSVWVRRVFPDTLVIEITEKIPVCMGLVGEKLVLLDEYGQPIKPYATGDALLLPVVRPPPNKDGPREVVWLINLLDRFPGLKEMISEAVGHAGKRWSLYTRRGVKLLISERADQELELLMKLQKKYRILDRKIRQVELRIPGKVAVRRQP